VPGEGDVKQWGKDFLHAYRRDAGWLNHTKKALEKIKTAAAELEVAGSRNEELRVQIIKAAKDRRSAEGQNVSEGEIERRLAEEGLIRLPTDIQHPLGEFKRIDVGGKPMSEMIIEERR